MAIRNRQMAGLISGASSSNLKSKILRAVITVLFLAFASGFIAVSLYNDRGAFTISVADSQKRNEYALSLSETKNFSKPTTVLNAEQFPEMTNMSGLDIPASVDTEEGGNHSMSVGKKESPTGTDQYYFAYTFFVQNSGSNTESYRYSIIKKESTQEIEKSIRIRLYINGEYTDYACQRENGSVEKNADENFMNTSTFVTKVRENFSVGEIDRYTLVIWVEGEDDDTGNDKIGGEIRLTMRFEVLDGADNA